MSRTIDCSINSLEEVSQQLSKYFYYVGTHHIWKIINSIITDKNTGCNQSLLGLEMNSLRRG